jgi:hypothetical protein
MNTAAPTTRPEPTAAARITRTSRHMRNARAHQISPVPPISPVSDTRRRPGERGSASVEAIGLTFPVLFTAVLLIVFCSRLTFAGTSVTTAASAAGRAASLASTPQAALTAARAAATTDLAGHEHTCRGMNVTLDAGLFRRGGTAVVTITCHVSTADLTGLSLPGHLTRSATSRSPIDIYRAISGGFARRTGTQAAGA